MCNLNNKVFIKNNTSRCSEIFKVTRLAHNYLLYMKYNVLNALTNSIICGISLRVTLVTTL